MVAAGDTLTRASAKDQGSSTLSGVVLSPKGAPRPGVPVTLRRGGDALIGDVRTGDDGSFRFANLALGVYTIVLPDITFAGIALDGTAARSLKLTQGAGVGQRYAVATRRLLPEEETGGRRILYGVVSGADGAGLNGPKVQMGWTNPEPGIEFPVAVAGSRADKPAGYFEFVTTPGVFALTIVDGDWPSDVAADLDTKSVPGRAGQPISYEVNFRLQPVPMARVEGVAAGARVDSRAKLLGASVPGGEQLAPLASDRSFAFTGLPPGRYRLELEGIGVIAETITLAPGGLFKLVFPVQSQVTGQVIGAQDGAVAVLHTPPPWGWTRQAILDQEGRFRFNGLPAGRYRITVAGLPPIAVELTGENQVALAPADVTAGRRSVLRGTVATPAGQPQEGVELILWRDGEEIARTQTAADGIFRFANLPPGTYSLCVAALGEVLHELALDGEAEHVLDVTWRLSSISGKLLDTGGQPQEGQAVRLLQASGQEVARIQTAADGAFRFTALAAGVYQLAVGDDVSAAIRVELAEGVDVSQDLRLAARKRLAHYLLLPPRRDDHKPDDVFARLTLALVLPYLWHTGATCGFSVQEAREAAQVTVAGWCLPADAEAQLKAAGCQVDQLPDDLNGLVIAIDQRVADTGRG